MIRRKCAFLSFDEDISQPTVTTARISVVVVKEEEEEVEEENNLSESTAELRNITSLPPFINILLLVIVFPATCAINATSKTDFHFLVVVNPVLLLLLLFLLRIIADPSRSSVFKS